MSAEQTTKGSVKFITLAACPPGLFITDDNAMGFKSEYGTNEGRIDAFCLESGEFFWGKPPQSIASQRATLVLPIEIETYTVSEDRGEDE